MPDLLVITPSRGRPGNAERLLKAVHATRKLDTHVWIGTDDDDPFLAGYEKMFFSTRLPGDKFATGPRKGLTEWTNHAARQYAGEYKYLASFGDDHLPRTPGWDRALVRAIEDMGGTGFAYPYDGIREDIPEAVAVSSNIVKALGWFCEPSLHHYFVDDVWADLGRHIGIRHLRAVAVDHLIPATGKSCADSTYQASSEKISADQESYIAWRAERMADDISTIKGLREQPA